MTPSTHTPSRRLVAVALATGVFSLAPALSAQKSSVPSKADPKTITHVLNRLGYGPRPGDVERVQAIGLEKYINEQLDPAKIDNSALDARLAEFTTLSMSTRDLAEKYYQPANEQRRDLKKEQAQQPPPKPAVGQDMTMTGAAQPPTPPQPNVQLTPEQRQIQQAQQNITNELMQAKVLRAALSDRQLEEVLSDFWFNHFNVFVGKGQVRQYLTEYERDAIRPYVLGNFRDMLGAVAHSPAMLFYLDNWQSQTPNPPVAVNQKFQVRLGNPNVGARQREEMMRRAQQQQDQQKRPQRGINENYARELMELHTLGVDGGYTQKDVIELARILTGWTIDRPQAGGEFVFNPRMHDTGPKQFLGVSFSAGGMDEGERALDILARHPATAHHIAYKLAQRFVADEPSKALVDRAAKVFTDSNGNLRDVTRAIVTSPEFFAADANRAKVKTPLEFVISAVRATGATVTNAQPIVVALRNLGMPVFGAQPPTGYSMTADAWVNTGALLNRMNFAVQLLDGGRIQPAEQPGRKGGPPPNPNQPGGFTRPQGRGRAQQMMARGPIQVDVARIAPDTSDASRDQVITGLLGGQVSDATRQTLARAESSQQLVALALGSPEFQKR
ncbi:MAG TPA: DUF1800 domain-containing protein [Vicinamibacterales bacterium]|nr:DUF1800 domain-containing protein [Vicinamibacterales bacterium]